MDPTRATVLGNLTIPTENDPGRFFNERETLFFSDVFLFLPRKISFFHSPDKHAEKKCRFFQTSLCFCRVQIFFFLTSTKKDCVFDSYLRVFFQKGVIFVTLAKILNVHQKKQF